MIVDVLLKTDMKPVKLSELIEALEFESEEHVTRVDLQNGSVVTVELAVLSAVEEGDEEALADLADWQKPEVEVARAMAEDPGERFVDVPDKFDFHEYREMERFIGTVSDSAVAEELWRAIEGKGAFRYFKDTANRLGLLKQWYEYRDNALNEFVADWAEARKILIEDDMKGRGNSS